MHKKILINNEKSYLFRAHEDKDLTKCQNANKTQA